MSVLRDHSTSPSGNIRKRRGWDSNPCARLDKRFSRPPRYDRFDTSPYRIFLKISFCALANARDMLSKGVHIVKHKFCTILKSISLFLSLFCSLTRCCVCVLVLIIRDIIAMLCVSTVVPFNRDFDCAQMIRNSALARQTVSSVYAVTMIHADRRQGLSR